MSRHAQVSDGSLCLPSLLALVLIGSAAVRGQEAELVLTPIRNIIATSNAATPDDDAGPENIVNGSGLNASGEHSSRGDGMWNGFNDGPICIQFEFDDIYELEEMWIWNYNPRFEWRLEDGVKEATLEYSENGTDWTIFGDIVCAQGTGQNDYTANTIVAMEGILARYVRLTILSSHSSSVSTFLSAGLSEVRFWTYTEALYRIYNVEATSTLTANAGSGPENTVNDSGMNTSGGHSTDWKDMWIADPNDGLAYIQFELDGLYELEEMWIWNCNTAGFQAKDVTIEHSENGLDWTVFGDVQFARATGDPDCPVSSVIALNGISTQYIRLTIHNTWPDNIIWAGGVEYERIGLSEVRFYTKQARSHGVLVLDDFEAYTDNENLGEAIFQTWIDTVLDGGTSQIGHTYTPFAETEIVHGDLQAMPFYYDNTRAPYYAETYRDLETEFRHWQIDDADALTLYFHGSEDKDHDIESDRLYVVVKDDLGGIAVAYHPEPEALLTDRWQQWSIDFADLAGVDLSGVTRLTLGIGDLTNPRRGAKSIIYIDDISLTKMATTTTDD